MAIGDRGRPILRGLVVWSMIIAAESINGTIRELFLVPAIGQQRARWISFALALGLITSIALYLSGWLRAQSAADYISVGLLWIVLTLAFEVGTIYLASHRPLDRLRLDYDPREGGLMLFGFVFLGTVPWITSMIRQAHWRVR